MTDSAGPTLSTSPEVTRSFRAMASPITLRVTDPQAQAAACLDGAEETFHEVERVCSRFDPRSDLSRVNAAPNRWHQVPITLAAAIQEAAQAYQATDGMFDPRVLGVLVGWGYDRSLPFSAGDVSRAGSGPDRSVGGAETIWRPEVVEDGVGWRIRLGETPVDLGGIGKGLAVRWAAEWLDRAGVGYLVDAGGDGAVGGPAPDGDVWRIGVEDPAGAPDPVLVLGLTDTGYATSSTRLRRWVAGGRPVHHLVDPRTARPGGDGLLSVTVVAPDSAWSEIWSKYLFLSGAAAIRARADELGIAAAWVAVDGSIGTTSPMDDKIIWRRTNV